VRHLGFVLFIGGEANSFFIKSFLFTGWDDVMGTFVEVFTSLFVGFFNNVGTALSSIVRSLMHDAIRFFFLIFLDLIQRILDIFGGSRLF
jgi:hypothetical protein